MNFSNSKPHFQILDGLRGVAALVVVAFHIFEAHATSHLDQMINHGYLAVDFFFLLSGFVIGYAYDDRWTKMSVGAFFKRRLLRLQPLVVLGSLIGAICFYYQDSVLWPLIQEVPLWKMLLVMLIGATLLPLPVSMDIRGWSEMHPLDGPGWSLFFEYLANIAYALWVRKFSKGMLRFLVVLSALALIHLALTSPKGDIIGGWSLNGEQLHIGFARVCYPFFAGLLLFRISSIVPVKNAFFSCSVLLVLILAMPRIGGEEMLWANGLYDSLSIIFVFPLIVLLGAGGKPENQFANQICSFFGDISYPIYITHYPLIYIYTGWVANNKLSIGEAWPVGIAVFFASVALAYASLKFYDLPMRKWLGKKIFSSSLSK